MISTFDKEWGDGYWGATPEAQTATSALIDEGTAIAADQLERSGRSGLAQTLQEWAPVVSTYVKQFQDPARQVDLLEARLANARERGASSGTIRLLEARLNAARRNAGLQAQNREQSSTIRTSAITAARVWTGAGVVLIGFLIYRAFAQNKAQ